ncbi:hypothetical protein CLOM_g13144 [Closterium sp. NIES-68]|nr:hypothetical protein CLOM_g13144 [Closterium sp. NIES-68]GJP81103.1 hypothetical protein CLOP_g11285 [Closterium sp. NIES-67]
MEAHFSPENWPQVLSDKLTESVEPDAIYLFLRESKAVNQATTDAKSVAVGSMAACTAETRMRAKAPGTIFSADTSQHECQKPSEPQVQEEGRSQQQRQLQLSSNARLGHNVTSQLWNTNASYQEMYGGCKGTNCTTGCKLAGFMHFRIVEEDEMASLYVYELQVEEEYQGMGIGSKLMRIAELIAKKCGLDAIFLTVQKKNTAARTLYMKKLGFQIADHSPARDEEREYEILVKEVA